MAQSLLRVPILPLKQASEGPTELRWDFLSELNVKTVSA
jgi:hypothetical protein